MAGQDSLGVRFVAGDGSGGDGEQGLHLGWRLFLGERVPRRELSADLDRRPHGSGWLPPDAGRKLGRCKRLHHACGARRQGVRHRRRPEHRWRLFAQQTVEASTNGSSWDDAGVADLFEPCDESQAFGFTSGQLANTIILAGCGQWPNAVPDVLQYDSAANTWSPAGTLNENRRNHAGAWLGTSGQSPMDILGGYSQASGFIDPTVTSELGPATTRPVSGGGSSAPHGSAGNVTTT